MAEEKRGLSGVVFLATLVGGILGTATGLLLAPQKGEKTREKLRETYEEAEKTIKSLMKKIGVNIPDLLSRATSDVKEIPEQVKSEVVTMKKDAEEVLSRVFDKGTGLFNEREKMAPSPKEGKRKYKKNLHK